MAKVCLKSFDFNHGNEQFEIETIAFLRQLQNIKWSNTGKQI